MVDQLPPILPYQTPTRITAPPNFGTRAAKVSWMVPLAAILLIAISLPLSRDNGDLALGCGVVMWLIGLLSGVVALATLRRYGRNRILRPAIVGLCLSLFTFLVLVGRVIIGQNAMGAISLPDGRPAIALAEEAAG